MSSSRSTIGTGLLLVALALAGKTVAALNSGRSLDPQFRAEGAANVHVTTEGRWYIWDNYKTVFEGEKIINTPKSPAEIVLRVRDSQGQELPVHHDDEQGWQIGNHSKHSLGYVDVPSRGELTIEVEGGTGERILSFGRAEIGNDLWRRLRGFAVAAVAAVVGVVLLLSGRGSKPVQAE